MKLIKYQSVFQLKPGDENYAMGKTIERIGKSFNITPYEYAVIKVYYHEWEMDGYAYLIIDTNGKKNLFMTNHGALYTATAECLRDRMDQYQMVLDQSQAIIDIMEN